MKMLKKWKKSLVIGIKIMNDDFEVIYKDTFESIVSECHLALSSIDYTQVKALIKLILDSRKVFFIGVGRVMLSLEAVAKRLAHCGIDTVCVGQIVEPAITSDDLLIAASGSGESLIPVAIAKKAKKFNAKVVMLGSNPQSTLCQLSDLFVRIPVNTKLNLDGEIKSSQIMTSLFEQSLLLFGDAVSKIIVNQKHIELESLWKYHANLE